MGEPRAASAANTAVSITLRETLNSILRQASNNGEIKRDTYGGTYTGNKPITCCRRLIAQLDPY